MQGLKETRYTDLQSCLKQGKQLHPSYLLGPGVDFWSDCWLLGGGRVSSLKYVLSKILVQEVRNPFCCGAHLFALAGRGWNGKNQKSECSPQYLQEVLYFADSGKGE